MKYKYPINNAFHFFVAFGIIDLIGIGVVNYSNPSNVILTITNLLLNII
jgi:hypothetical protein